MGVFLSAFHCLAFAQISPQTIEAYQQQNWQVAIRQLIQQQDEPGAGRLLALSYFHQPDFELALPALRTSLQTTPDDIELNTALLEVLLTNGVNAEASQIAQRLEQLGEPEVAAFGLARIQLQEGDRAQAKNNFIPWLLKRNRK